MNRFHVPMRCTFALFLIAVLAACQRNEAPAPAVVADPAADATPVAPPAETGTTTAITETAVAAFLATQYGSGAKLVGKWTGAPVDAALKQAGEADGAVTRHVCAREDAAVGGRAAVLLAVCGTPGDFGHPTPGITDFFLLQDDAGTLAAAARAHKQEYGSMGNAGEVDVERFGADLYGFEIESGFFNMGEGVETRAIVLPKDGGFIESGWLRKSMRYGEGMDDCDERGDCPADGYEIEFDLDIDASDPQAAAYPLLVRESGTACRKPAQGEYRLLLDPATLTYAVPKALQRESGCLAQG